MNPVYFKTQFHRKGSDDWSDLPAAFAVITAYPTTGEKWPAEEVAAADQSLENELRQRSKWVRRLTDFDPDSGWAEPGWAAAIDFDAACDLGVRFRQDALYYIAGDELYVSHCDARRSLVKVGRFRERLHVEQDSN